MKTIISDLSHRKFPRSRAALRNLRCLGVLLLSFCAGLSVHSKAEDYSAEDLNRRATERRAVEAVIWGMPAVNAELMFQAMKDAQADFNQVVYWSRPLSWKNQT